MPATASTSVSTVTADAQLTLDAVTIASFVPTLTATANDLERESQVDRIIARAERLETQAKRLRDRAASLAPSSSPES